jgi:beta-glucosidase
MVACQGATPPPVLQTPTSTGSPGIIQQPAILATTEQTSSDLLPYQDPRFTATERAADLLSRMTLEEKIGQMTQVEKDSIQAPDVVQYFIGSVLSGGGGSPNQNTPAAWANMVNTYQDYALKTRLGIPIIYGVDAVHGHGNLYGATIFPHNIGLGAAGDPDLVERIGRATAREMVATSIRWNFAPVVAVPQDVRWGRTYEGYSENTDLVTSLSTAYIRGLQSIDGITNLSNPFAVLATPKHFIGDGGTQWNSSSTYKIDQGDMKVDESTLRELFLPPYQAAVEAGAQSIMVSFSSWNGVKMHAQEYLLTNVLKNELGFSGFLVSDWQAIDQIPGEYYSDVVTSINAGIDMVMVPYEYRAFIETLAKAVSAGDVSINRIDDAVLRILKVKFELGLFEQPYSDPAALALVGSDTHRELARQAVRASLVLLKNDSKTLPLDREAPVIFVAGTFADNIGAQCGGWTIDWQGNLGQIQPGTTILEAIQNTVSGQTQVYYDPQGNFSQVLAADNSALNADIGIVVIGEKPYSEGQGDTANLSIPEADASLVSRVQERSEKVVVILLSGRPVIITPYIRAWDAVVAAWWPGTEAQGIADVIFGDYPFTGKLPYTWPRWTDQLPFDFNNLPQEGCEAPLFPYGYGLDTGDPSPEIPDCPTK